MAWTPKTYPIHPACAAFPETNEEDFERMLVDIDANGVAEAIKLFDGMLVDGRTRLKCCNRLKIECPVWFLSADEMEGWTVEAYVLAQNLARRHLTASQRAALGISARGATLHHGDADERARVFGKVPKGRASERIAKHVGVSRRTVDKVEAIQKKNPAAFAAVVAGTMSLAEAEKSVIVDGEGNAVTREKFQEIFRTMAVMAEAARLASRSKALLKSIVGRPGAEELVVSDTMGKLGAARINIINAMPYVTCPYCGGTRSGECELCRSRMWVTKDEAEKAAGGAE